MDLKKKRKQEIDEQKERRKEEVVLAAIEVFKEKGIENAKMTDVAEKAQVGIASVYRYFKTKQELAIEAATMLWKVEANAFLEAYDNEDFKKQDGLAKVRSTLEVFLFLFKEHQHFLRLISEFDNYVIREEVDADKLSEYEDSIIDFRSMTLDAIESGKQDGSIKNKIEANEFYITITHTLMSLSQKLLLRGRILKSDDEVSGEAQIRMVIEMAIEYLKA